MKYLLTEFGNFYGHEAFDNIIIAMPIDYIVLYMDDKMKIVSYKTLDYNLKFNKTRYQIYMLFDVQKNKIVKNLNLTFCDPGIQYKNEITIYKNTLFKSQDIYVGVTKENLGLIIFDIEFNSEISEEELFELLDKINPDIEFFVIEKTIDFVSAVIVENEMERGGCEEFNVHHERKIFGEETFPDEI